jgi:hypothetical protein
MLPLDDPRLDFQMVDSILRNPSTTTMVRKTRDLFLGWILLNPSKPGVIESKITLSLLSQRTNRTFEIDVPIIGMVHHEANVFGSGQVHVLSNEKSNYPLPLVSFDVSEHLLSKTAKRKVNEVPQFRQAILTTPLMIKNTFKVPIKLRGIVNNNPELRVMIENNTGNHYTQGLILQPG